MDTTNKLKYITIGELEKYHTKGEFDKFHTVFLFNNSFIHSLIHSHIHANIFIPIFNFFQTLTTCKLSPNLWTTGICYFRRCTISKCTSDLVFITSDRGRPVGFLALPSCCGPDGPCVCASTLTSRYRRRGRE